MKRFVECRRWEDKWFCRLSPDAKLIFSYLCDQCDHGGMWDCNFELATFQIGFHRINRIIDWESVLVEMNADKRTPGAIYCVPGAPTRWWIVNFVNFQYGPTKLRKTPSHIPVFRSLIKGGVWHIFLELYPELVEEDCKLNPPVTMEAPCQTGPPPTYEELRFWKESEGLPDQEVLHFHSYWASRGWKRGKESLRDRRSALVDWKLRWIKEEDKRQTPTQIQQKIDAINKQVAALGLKQRLKPGTSFTEPDPGAMEEIRGLRALKKRYNDLLCGKIESHPPPATAGSQAALNPPSPPVT